jgi:ABC-2 type transport system ATP-binding protein
LDIIKIENVSKSYATHKALENVSMAIPKGCIFGLLGPNGAGKTTLIRIITQIFTADSGQIWFNGEKLNPDHISRIGYMPEERGLYKKMKVGEQLLYLAQLKGLSRADAMEKLKVWFQKFEITTWWGKNVEDLSKGMQQKIQFIGTVLHEPELIILDEPFSGFDPINANLIKDEILELKRNGSTIIFSTHRMESVEELCDYVALIHKSHKILDGAKTDIKNQHKTNIFSFEVAASSVPMTNKFEVISQSVENGLLKASVKMINGTTPNELLSSLMQSGQVHSFQEKIPSMNEIFISNVKGAVDHE